MLQGSGNPITQRRIERAIVAVVILVLGMILLLQGGARLHRLQQGLQMEAHLVWMPFAAVVVGAALVFPAAIAIARVLPRAGGPKDFTPQPAAPAAPPAAEPAGPAKPSPVRFSRLLRTVWLFALAVILGAAFAGLHLLTQEPLPQEWRPVVFAALDHPVATPFLLLFAGAVVLAASLFLAFLLLVLLGAGGAYWALARYLLLD